jgi:hypothetical protein
LSLTRITKWAPVVKEESYFYSKEGRAGTEALPDALTSRSGGVVPFQKAPRGKGAESISLRWFPGEFD